jgi:hypothetical protein
MPLREARVSGDALLVDLWYPRVEGSVKAVEVGLVDVRAADAIRIEYDFGRDGWVIKQASRFQWDADDPAMDPDWQEVAFVQAWARDASPDDDEPKAKRGRKA